MVIVSDPMEVGPVPEAEVELGTGCGAVFDALFHGPSTHCFMMLTSVKVCPFLTGVKSSGYDGPKLPAPPTPQGPRRRPSWR